MTHIYGLTKKKNNKKKQAVLLCVSLGSMQRLNTVSGALIGCCSYVLADFMWTTAANPSALNNRITRVA